MLSGCGLVRLGKHEPPPGRSIVVYVGIEGNDQVSGADLIAGLSTHSDNFGSYEDKPLLSKIEAREDHQRLESAYAALGYFQAKCKGHRIERVDDVSVRVYFRVEEGPPTLVRQVVFRGLNVPAGADDDTRDRLFEIRQEAAEYATIQPGQVWTSRRYQADKQRLRAHLLASGFSFAEVVGRVEVDRDERTAVVIYDIIPGPLARIAGVKIQGASIVSAERIRRRVDLQPGEIVDPAALSRVERQVKGLGMFYAVAAKVDRPPLDTLLGDKPITAENLRALKHDPNVTILLTVQERKVHELRTGAGLSVDNERSGVRALGSYINLNLGGGLRRLELSVTPAYYALPSAFDVQTHGPGVDVESRFRQPSFIDEYLNFDGATTYALGVETSYKKHEAATRLAFSRTFFAHLTPYIAYSLNYQDLFDVQAGTDLRSINLFDNFFLATLELGAILDYRDDLLDPRRGGYVAAEVLLSAPELGSAYGYVQATVDLRGYLPVSRWMTLAFRAAWWHSFDLSDEPPVTEWFQGGGASDMRGYASQTMGVSACRSSDGSLNIDPTGECAGEGQSLFDTVGGKIKGLVSLEARLFLPFDIGLVAFVDVGQAWQTIDEVSRHGIDVAVGPGLRYFTVIGPVRADLGILLTSDAVETVFHFSIGQAF